MSTLHRIAVIPGDGIGTEVVPEAAGPGRGSISVRLEPKIRALRLRLSRLLHQARENAAGRMVRGTEPVRFHLLRSRRLARRRPRPHLAVGGKSPAVPPPLRPVRQPPPGQTPPGVPSPLTGRVPPGDVDFYVVRENTEGEYSSIGGKIFEGTDRETVIQETVMTRTGVDRILKYAFDLAQSRPKKHLTSATKSNGISITMPYWDERVQAMSAAHPRGRR